MNQVNLEWIQTELSNQLKNYQIENRDIYIFGAGTRGRLCIPYLKEHTNLKAICDNDSTRWGTYIDSVEIISPDAIPTGGTVKPLVLISVPQAYPSMAHQLEVMGIPYCNLYSFIYALDFDRIKQVADVILTDEYSKTVYLTYIASLVTNNPKLLHSIFECDTQYFALPQFNIADRESIYVDCGAFVGDTFEVYANKTLGRFQHYYAFEPGLQQYEALTHRVKRILNETVIRPEQIILENKGCGEKSGTFTLALHPQESSGDYIGESDHGYEVEVVSLDDYFLHRDGKVSCIKADIEGAELEMLHGAKEIIQRDRPQLALSLYHRAVDVFTLPIYIKELVPEYQMAVRHHSAYYEESVLYCWVES